MRVKNTVRGVASILSLAGWAAFGVPAQHAYAQAAPASRFVAIGCISRSADQFTITDGRSTPPRTYRLDGDVKQLALHVGHTVEVAGTLSAGQPMAMKVASLTYISPTCTPPKK
jgi:hypothetical protein